MSSRTVGVENIPQRRMSPFLAWENAFRKRTFLIETVLTVIVLIIVIRVCAHVMNFVEMRKGVSLPDPILSSFQPYNLRWPIFIILWGTIFGTIVHLFRHPEYLVMGLQAGAILLIFRTVALCIMPLEPMRTIIPLADPIVESLGAGKLVVKDLFFSGHTSVVFLCAVASRRTAWKVLCLVSTVAVGLGVILQHVHYSADVYTAPFFAYASWRIALLAHQKLPVD